MVSHFTKDPDLVPVSQALHALCLGTQRPGMASLLGAAMRHLGEPEGYERRLQEQRITHLTFVLCIPRMRTKEPVREKDKFGLKLRMDF